MKKRWNVFDMPTFIIELFKSRSSFLGFLFRVIWKNGEKVYLQVFFLGKINL